MKFLLLLCIAVQSLTTQIVVNGFAITQLDFPAIPHITRPGNGFTTKIILPNTSGDSIENFPFLARDAQGNIITADDFDVPPGHVRIVDRESLLLSSPEVASVTTFDSNVSYAFEYESGSASPANFQIVPTKSNKYILFPGNWNYDSDSFAIYNSSIAPLDVRIRQISFSGIVLEENVLSQLLPYSNTKAVLGGPGISTYSNTTNSYFEFEGSDLFVLIGLRSNTTTLWPNYPQAQAQPLPQVESMILDQSSIHYGDVVTCRIKAKYTTSIKVYYSFPYTPSRLNHQLYQAKIIAPGVLLQSFANWPANGTIWAEITGPGGTIETPVLQVSVID